MKKYEIYCICGDIIEANNKKEAIKKFDEKHNFPKQNTYHKDRMDYSEEFEVTEVM